MENMLILIAVLYIIKNLSNRHRLPLAHQGPLNPDDQVRDPSGSFTVSFPNNHFAHLGTLSLDLHLLPNTQNRFIFPL